MKSFIFLISLLLGVSSFAKTWTCTNQSSADDQSYPSKITLVMSEKEASITAVEVDENSKSIATAGVTFKATRLDSKKEAKYKVPTYIVQDGEKIKGKYTYFANDERDTDIMMFVNADKTVTFWLHYNGGDYEGIDKDTFECK